MTTANNLVLVERISAASDTVHRLDLKERYEYDHPEVVAPELIGASTTSVVTSSVKSVTTGYIFPPEIWSVLTTKKIRERWETPVVLPTDKLDDWALFTAPRIAYVREWNWEKKGVRGLFSLTHWTQSNFGLEWCIAAEISPGYTSRLVANTGQAKTRYAVLSRNVYWMSAAIGAFYPQGLPGGSITKPVFLVHYNDTGDRRLLHLPLDAVMTYIGEQRALQGKTPPTAKQAAAAAAATEPPAEKQEPEGERAAAAVPAPPPLINETFEDIDMQRFWPQFMMALQISLHSITKSSSLIESLQLQPTYWRLDSFVHNRGNTFEYVPPMYEGDTDRVGNYAMPEYMQ